MEPRRAPAPRHYIGPRRRAAVKHPDWDAPPPPAADPLAWLKLAATIVASASREQPADALLRHHLKNAPDVTREMSRQVSQAVFGYFRWRGWVDANLKPESQIRSALEKVEAFAHRPETITNAELKLRCVPDWVSEVMSVDATWLRALQHEPRLWLRVKPGRLQALAQVLGYTERCALPDALAYTGEADLFRRPEFHAGEFEIQDIASQAVGMICAPQPGETWWDACAGEGGKLLHLSELMRGKGMIWASDRTEWRLKKLKIRAARAQCFNYRAALWQGGPKLPTKTRFDGVLVDAPCSGLGTWQRNPHARWTTTPEDVRELAAVQLQLLRNAAAAVKPGGRLVYSVCSLPRAETTDVAAAFQAGHPEFQPLPGPNPFHSNEKPKPQQLFTPQDNGGNGMFVALWQRAG